MLEDGKDTHCHQPKPKGLIAVNAAFARAFGTQKPGDLQHDAYPKMFEKTRAVNVIGFDLAHTVISGISSDVLAGVKYSYASPMWVSSFISLSFCCSPPPSIAFTTYV